MSSRQESTYCREGESIEVAQKGISREKSQDFAKATENNGHVEGGAAQVNDAQTDDAMKDTISRSAAREEEQTPDLFPQDIKSKITMLLVVIDQIDSDFKQARELILEIAKRLDEQGVCERNEISRTLKKILRDKIQNGKITEKWIEEVKYLVYPNGKTMVFVACSNNPFKLEDESDVSIIYAFLGQVRDRLLYLMTDPHERIVPSIMKWILTGCDINKDVTVSDKLQLTAINIQLKDADRVFRLYIKSLGDKAVCRVEESLKMRCALVDVLRTIRSPSDMMLSNRGLVDIKK